jgi:hypothetical protein
MILPSSRGYPAEDLIQLLKFAFIVDKKLRQLKLGTIITK